MLSLNERLRILEEDLKAIPMRISAYHDLPFAIFHYKPNKEMQMRKEITLLATRLENKTNKKVRIISLANLLWKAIEETEGIDSIILEEKNIGFERAQWTINNILSDSDFKPLPDLLITELKGLDPSESIAFIIRVASLAPRLYQISQLFGHIQGKTTVPSILFYPGSLRGTTQLCFMDMLDNRPIGSYRVKIY